MKLFKNPERPWKILVFLIGTGITLGLGAFFFWSSGSLFLAPPAPGKLVLHHPLGDAREVSALHSAVERFRSLYPQITLQVFTGDLYAGMTADVASTRNPGLPDDYLEPPRPWSGETWFLAVRKDLVETGAKSVPGPAKALLEGRGTTEDFQTVAGALKTQGITPITLGNSHQWPFLLWLQHWTAATASSPSLSRLPGESDSTDTDLYAPFREPFKTLMRWKEDGWFLESAWSRGWAAGLMPLKEGSAAFALTSSAYLGPLGDFRDNLVFVPFPRNSGNWLIGSAVFLTVRKDTTYPEAAALLAKFLTSPGTTEALSQRAGKPYFSWVPATETMAEILPSWADAALTPDYQAMAREFDPGK